MQKRIGCFLAKKELEYSMDWKHKHNALPRMTELDFVAILGLEPRVALHNAFRGKSVI
jgi:hypothetical protein